MKPDNSRGFVYALLLAMACAWIGMRFGALPERRRTAESETARQIPTAVPDWSAAENTPLLAGARELVAMRVAAVGPTILETGDGEPPYVVMLRDDHDALALPIFIGPAEGQAMLRRLAGAEPLRPMTHDLFEKTLHRLGGRVTKVIIDDIQSDVFFGFVYFETRDGVFVIDARPSDAITLATGAHAPIWATRRVLQRAGLSGDPATTVDDAVRPFAADNGSSL